ncbi:MAG: hypothetical protein ACUVXF_05510 [Desulfobaccales bacterium]
MGESRGRKAKKAKWQVQLGVRDLIFTGLGMAGLVMLSFALGIMAGRGDLYRLLCNWGLLSPDHSKVFQTWQPVPTTPAPTTPVAAVSEEASAEPAAQEKPPPSAATPQAPSHPPAPVKGTIAEPLNPLQAPKKTPPQTPAKENKVEKIRQEVAKKLRFQNSLDLSTSRAAPASPKGRKGDDKEASKPSTTPVLVAKFRDAARARGKLAQMQKQGEKVYLKEGKDGEGNFFALYRQVGAAPSKPPQVAQKPEAKKARPENRPGKSSPP